MDINYYLWFLGVILIASRAQIVQEFTVLQYIALYLERIRASVFVEELGFCDWNDFSLIRLCVNIFLCVLYVRKMWITPPHHQVFWEVYLSSLFDINVYSRRALFQIFMELPWCLSCKHTSTPFIPGFWMQAWLLLQGCCLLASSH